MEETIDRHTSPPHEVLPYFPVVAAATLPKLSFRASIFFLVSKMR
jgi:hypothetical protein